MINVVVGLPRDVTASTSASPNASSSVLSSQSFESELSEAISDALSKFGIDPGSVQLTVEDSAGENLGTSQNSASASSSASPSPSTSTPVATTPTTTATPVVAATPVSTTTANAPATRSAAASNAADSSSSTPPPSFDDQYWSQQPPAVQQLRNIQDQSQRNALGEQLATEGYSIDVPIMVWGWDPAVTTQLRQSYGYTWVPSGLQAPIETAPGINIPGITPYNPNNPPPGSIAV